MTTTQRTILVVDDAPICREPIAAGLRLAGFQTLAAADGQTALDLIAGGTVDLVLLDVAMPSMDGITVLRKIRANPKHANLPVIMLTALSDQSFRSAVAPLRPADYLIKSHLCLSDLLARVRKHLTAAA